MPESSQYKQEFRSLGPGNLQASPGDHTHDGITSKSLTTYIAYTPEWTATTTNPVVNNGSLTGRYFLLGDVVFYDIFLTIGGTTTLGSGAYRFTLPFTPAATYAAYSQLGVASIMQLAASTTYTYFAKNIAVSDNKVQLSSNTASAQTNTSPFTMSSTGGIHITGSYQKA